MKAEGVRLMAKFKNGTISREELLKLREILLKDIESMSSIDELACVGVGYLLGITEAALSFESIMMAIETETGERVLIN